MPSSSGRFRLACVIVAAATWTVDAGTTLATARPFTVQAIVLLLAWTVTVAGPATVLAVRVHTSHRRVVVVHRAYQLGLAHGRQSCEP